MKGCRDAQYRVIKTQIGIQVINWGWVFILSFLQLFKSKALRLFIASEGPPGQLLESPSKDPKGSKDHRIGFNSIF